MLAVGNKRVALPFSVCCENAPTEAWTGRGARDLINNNEVIDEIKQHEDFTLTYRVLDLTSCGLIGVSDTSLGRRSFWLSHQS